MPRYFFDIRDGDNLVPDNEGIELPSVDAAQVEAARSLADLAREAVHEHRTRTAHRMAIEVRDAAGPVLQANFTFEIARHHH